MHLTRFATHWMAVALRLLVLCAFTPQYAAVPTDLAIQNTAFVPHNKTTTGPWYERAYDYSQSILATAYTIVDVDLPSWNKTVGVVAGFLHKTDEDLNRTAREYNISDKVEELRSTFRDVVEIAAEFREHMKQRGMTLDDVSDELGEAFDDVLTHMKLTFPSPDQAPSHEERQAMVTTLLEKVAEALRRFAVEHGKSQEVTDKILATFERLRPKVVQLVVITGDLIEQHPILFDIVVITATAMLIPEGFILRPLLSLIGFGPFGPIKGSSAAWAQRRFWGATVAKGSWFAVLTRAGMTLSLPWWQWTAVTFVAAIIWFGKLMPVYTAV